MPSKLAEEYRISVRMTAGPFEVDDKAESTLRRSDLVPPKTEEKSDESAGAAEGSGTLTVTPE
ncbi:MAG: hypothetical protein ABSG86_27020 [Thermoguttaceae bacterium]